jgi:predicted MFS family arabinose efflux permease
MNVFFTSASTFPTSRWVLFSLSAVLTGIGSIIGPRLAANLGSKIRAVVLTQGLSLAFLLVVGFSPYLWMASVGFLARGTLMNMAVPLYSAFAMEQVREREQATVNSVKELAWQFGWAVGPYLSGVVQEAYGFTPLFITTAVMYATAIFLTWVFFGGREAIVQPVREEGLPVLEGVDSI